MSRLSPLIDDKRPQLNIQELFESFRNSWRARKNLELLDFASFFGLSGNEYLTGVKETSDDYLVVLEVFLAEKKLI